MSQSHVAGWTSDSPTPAQLKELFAQIGSGRITGQSLQGFLRGATETLGIHKLEVNYDDRAWLSIGPVRYATISGVAYHDFPVTRTGKAIVRYRLLAIAKVTTIYDVLDQIERENCRLPDRAEAETIIESFPQRELGAAHIVGIVGRAVRDDGNRRIAYILGDELGMSLHCAEVTRNLLPTRVIAVCK